MAPRTRATRSDGARSREAILATATELASVHGLDGLSIGDLAEAVGMSKSGLYAHFDSKEALQLATVQAARDIFVTQVVEPAFTHETPIAQLRALCENFLRYVEERVFPGGCFFVSASAEWGARPGAVHDVVADAQREWASLLRELATAAVAAGTLDEGTDPDVLAFEIGAMLAGTNLTYVLHEDPALLARARQAVATLLG